MAQELLDEADLRPAFEHVGGASVADEVAASAPADLGLLDVFGGQAAEDVGVEGFAVAGDEEGLFLWIKEEPGADFFEVAAKPVQGALSDGHDAVFFAFAKVDLQDAALAVEVVDFQVGQLAAADAGAVKGFEDGSVADAEWIE